MNSLIWSDNRILLKDMIEEYCNEEKIYFDKGKLELFDNILSSYKNKVSTVDELTDINKEVLQKFMLTIETQNYNKREQYTEKQTQPFYNNSKVDTKPNSNINPSKPESIYSRDDIINERNNHIQEKYNNIREDFANFNLKKPEDIDFSDKVDDEDNVSIDKKIEQELLKRKYDIMNIEYKKQDDIPFLDDTISSTHINGDNKFDTQSENKKLQITNKIIENKPDLELKHVNKKHVTFETTESKEAREIYETHETHQEHRIHNVKNSFFDKLKKKSNIVTDINNENNNKGNSTNQNNSYNIQNREKLENKINDNILFITLETKISNIEERIYSIENSIDKILKVVFNE